MRVCREHLWKSHVWQCWPGNLESRCWSDNLSQEIMNEVSQIGVFCCVSYHAYDECTVIHSRHSSSRIFEFSDKNCRKRWEKSTHTFQKRTEKKSNAVWQCLVSALPIGLPRLWRPVGPTVVWIALRTSLGDVTMGQRHPFPTLIFQWAIFLSRAYKTLHGQWQTGFCGARVFVHENRPVFSAVTEELQITVYHPHWRCVYIGVWQVWKEFFRLRTEDMWRRRTGLILTGNNEETVHPGVIHCMPCSAPHVCAGNGKQMAQGAAAYFCVFVVLDFNRPAIFYVHGL